MPKRRYFEINIFVDTKKDIDKLWDKIIRPVVGKKWCSVSSVTQVDEEYTKTFDNAAERALKRIEEELESPKYNVTTGLTDYHLGQATTLASVRDVLKEELKRYHGL